MDVYVSFIHQIIILRQKLDPKSRNAIFVGYPLDTKVYDLDSKRFVRSRNILFHESKFHNFELVNKETVLHEDDVNESCADDVQSTDAIGVEPTIPPTIPEPAENIPAVGATYEETFMRQVGSLGPTRQRKSPERFHPNGCLITESLTADHNLSKKL